MYDSPAFQKSIQQWIEGVGCLRLACDSESLFRVTRSEPRRDARRRLLSLTTGQPPMKTCVEIYQKVLSASKQDGNWQINIKKHGISTDRNTFQEQTMMSFQQMGITWIGNVTSNPQSFLDPSKCAVAEHISK